MPINYDRLPTAEQFKKDSSIFLADRSRDKVLLELDKLLGDYARINEATPEQTMIKKQLTLARLWFAGDYWLKVVDGGAKYAAEAANMNSGRRPVIYALYTAIVKTLSETTNVPVNKLPDWLELCFGRVIGLSGIATDQGRTVIQIDPEDLRWFRLQITGGIAYQHRWWQNSQELVRADSKNTLMAASADPKAHEEGLSGYAVSMGRDFYLAPHFVNRANSKDHAIKENFYHSSYFGGRPVLCSGTIKIVNGEIQVITNDSGHFRPTPAHLAQAVEALGILGVSLAKLQVRAMGMERCSGIEFLTKVPFNLKETQFQEFYRQLQAIWEFKMMGDAGRKARVEKQKEVQALAAHLKAEHKSKRGFRCATCARYLDRDVMTLALFFLDNQKKAA